MTDPAPRRAKMANLVALASLARPKEWVKNSFVLAPLVFVGRFADPSAVRPALLAALLFCVASSATYIVNDIYDIELDRRHPKKSVTRPLAAGTVTVPMALVLLSALYGVLALAWFAVPEVMLAITGYVLLNLGYTFVLKHQPVLDMFTIAIGFVLRVYAGALALSVAVSAWMLVTTLCLALFLAAIKRRQELVYSSAHGRPVLGKYSLPLVDRYAAMSATGALVFYSLFVISAKPQLVGTIPLVLFGLYRYWYVVEQPDGGESPTDALLADWQLLTTVLLWVGICAWALWPVKG